MRKKNAAKKNNGEGGREGGREVGREGEINRVRMYKYLFCI